MDKAKAKVFTIFWLVSGAAWTAASVKRAIEGEDTIVITVYAITALISFALAFNFYRRR